MFPHEIVTEKVLVQGTLPDSPAARAGIRVGDQILVVDWVAIHNVSDLRNRIYVNLGRKINVLVMHPDRTTENFTITPRWIVSGAQNATGLVVIGSNQERIEHRYPIWQAIPKGFAETVDMFITFKNVIVSMFLGITPVVLTGPVGLVQVLNELMNSGISLSSLIDLTAFLSGNLALLNMFPIPALDGGRMVFIILEWVRGGKRLSPKTEGLIHGTGFALLLLFMVGIAFQDVLRIIHGTRLIK